MVNPRASSGATSGAPIFAEHFDSIFWLFAPHAINLHLIVLNELILIGAQNKPSYYKPF